MGFQAVGRSSRSEKDQKQRSSSGCFFLIVLITATSRLVESDLKRISEQFPSLRPSQVSCLFFTHSLLRVWDSLLVVQHFARSQICIVTSSSVPVAPTWTISFFI